MRVYRLLYLCILLLVCNRGLSQNDTCLSLSHEKWEKISEGTDYAETYFDRDASEPKNRSNNTKSPQHYFSSLRYIIYMLVLGLIIFLIVLVVRNFKRNKTVVEKTISIDSIQEIEEKMHEIDLERLLKDALMLKNYRIALRLNFLIIIKLLTQRGKIKWAKEKTNWEYYSELKEKLLADKFKEIILSFEAVWYGEYGLTEVQYYQAEPQYKALQKQLNPNEQK